MSAAALIESVSPVPPALLTDLYQFTMAQGYWKLGMHEREAIFELFYRENPFHGGYVIVAGLEQIVQAISNYRITDSDLAYLSSLTGADNKPLFSQMFLKTLQGMKLSIDLVAIPEGTLVFPKEPLLQVKGPLWQCQLLETLLLNLINFPSLIATKTSRVCYAAGESPVVEFGLRRAQGPDGGLTASRAAYIGGAIATSNVLAGKIFGIPLRGTHAHSWVMAFSSEKLAFQAYADSLPNNCVFLVDTYRSEEGIREAIEVGLKLKEKGYPFLGIRLDSGDLHNLSLLARKMLDAAGLKSAEIYASNDLDEYAIHDLKIKGAAISTWGVGTRLVTGYDQPALGGVYKLVAIQNESGEWKYKAKQTDDVRKSTVAGIHRARRYIKEGEFLQDILYTIEPSEWFSSVSEFLDCQAFKEQGYDELMHVIFKQGELVFQLPTLTEIRERSLKQLSALPKEVRLLHPSINYPVLLPKNIMREEF